MSLTEEQRTAANCSDNLLLRACPGSGKTRVITTKLMTAIEEVRHTPRKIACITYTNSAVHEIEERVSKVLIPNDDEYFEVSTIHAFCLNNILRHFHWRVTGYEKGFKLLTREMDEFTQLVDAACAELNYFRPLHQDYEDFASINIDASGKPIGSALRNNIVKQGANIFWRFCREKGFIDFCTLLYLSLGLLRTYPELSESVASRYALILVDEFQDTSELQVEILTEIAAKRRTRFFLVGDTYQSIFGFAGARPELADVFAARINARCDLSLSGNFRSSKLIIADAERLFPRSPPMWAAGDAQAHTERTQHLHMSGPESAIIECFLPALEEFGIPLGEATVLAPSWNHLFPLSRALRDQGISVVGPGARPYKRGRLFALLAEQLCGSIVDPRPGNLGAIERSLFYLVQEITGQPRFDIFSYAGRVAALRLLAVAQSHVDVASGALQWLDDCSTEIGRIMVDLDYIAPSQAPLLYTSVQEMKADMHRNHLDTGNYSIEDLGLFASPNRALKLSTLHFAKGREYTAVAMIKMHEGAIPFYLAQTSDELEEAQRLFYVGVTRAKRLLMYCTDWSDRRNRTTRFLGPKGTGHVS